MIVQIRLLEQLQQIDAQIMEMESTLAALPARLKTMRDNLARVENLLADERARLAEAEKMHGERERELKMEDEQIHRSKLKLQQVRNNKEYLATSRELETLRKVYSDHQEEILKLMEAIERFRASIAQHDSELTELRSQVAAEDKVARERMEVVAAEIAKERKSRDAIGKQVRPDWLKKYNHIRLRRGLAVVPVRGGTCTGCNMSLPPQMYNLLQRGDQIMTCPSCHRIVYFEPQANEPPSEAQTT